MVLVGGGDGDGERESLRNRRTIGNGPEEKKKKEEEEDEMNARKRDDDTEQSDCLKDGNDRHDPEEQEQEEQIKLRTLHETHKHAVTVMSVLKGDGCVFIASGDAGGEVVIYEKKSKRIVSINAGLTLNASSALYQLLSGTVMEIIIRADKLSLSR